MSYTVREAHRDVRINLDTPQPFTDICGRTRKVYGLRLQFDRTPTVDRTTITVEFKDSASLVCPVETVPPWMQEIVDAHKPTAPAYELR